MKRQSGFTLIELLVVIAIIGILSTIVLATLEEARVRGRDARRLSDVQQLRTALELYYDNNGQYPPYKAYTEYVDPCGLNWCNLQTALAPYIPAMPFDPLYPNDSNNQYRYYYEANSGDTYATYGAMVRMESPSNHPLADNDGGSPAYEEDGTYFEVGEQPSYCRTKDNNPADGNPDMVDWWNSGSNVCDDGN